MKQAACHGMRPLGTAGGTALQNPRRIRAGREAVEESLSFGPPAFGVRGTPFAVPDRYRDSDCLWLTVPPAKRAALLATPGWFLAPYAPRHAALCMRLEAIDRRRIRPPVRIGCALAAAPRNRAPACRGTDR